MKHLIMGLLISISTPGQANNLTLGLEYGQGFFPQKEFQSENKNLLLGIRLQSQYKFLNYGLGYQRQELGYNFSKGYFLSSEIISNNLYLYLSPRLEITPKWDISLENKIMLNDSIATGMDSNQKIFSGLGLGYNHNYNKVNYRLALNVSQGMDFNHSATLAMISLEFKFKEKPIEPLKKETVLIKNKKIIIHSFNYKETKLNDLSFLLALKKAVSNAKINHTTLIGHTDKIGGDEYNIKLGQKRAEFIQEVLEISANIESQGFREQIYDDDHQNRRVEIIFNLDVLHPHNEELMNLINRGSP